MSTTDENEFQVVTGKRKTNRKNYRIPLELINKDDNEISEEKVLRRVRQISKNRKFVEFLQETWTLLDRAKKEPKLENISKLVCLGLGSFTNCPSALHQLAFALQVQTFLGIKNAEFYDPVLNKTEIRILEGFGWKLTSKNYGGKYPVTQPTLFYFPHCHRQLTNCFLWENWKSDLLSQTILICNSFSTLVSNTPERLLHQDAEYILKLSEHTSELALKNYHMHCVFNDTSIHTFLEKRLPRVDSEFWSKTDDPICTDIEITKENKSN